MTRGQPDCLEQCIAARPLDSEDAVVLALVCHGNAGACCGRCERGNHCIGVARVGDDESVVIVDAIDDEIVDHATTVVAEQVVLRLPGSDAVEVVRDHRVEPRDRARPDHLGVAHVRDVEDADVFAHGGVLGDGADVLDRHVPAAEVGHLGAEGDMAGVQRRLAQAHAPTVAVSRRCRGWRRSGRVR